jgi:hypothetical protein
VNKGNRVRYAAPLTVALFVMLPVTARGQSTADLVSRLQQKASAARAGQLNEDAAQLLQELEKELASDRYPSGAALRVLAAELSKTGSRLDSLAPDAQTLAQRYSTLAETPLSDSHWSASWPTNGSANLEDERPLLRQAINRCRARLNRLAPTLRTAWDEYLCWSDVQGLTQGAALDEAVLNRLEARWTNFHLAWNDPELSRTALAVHHFIRHARRNGEAPPPEAIAGRLAAVALLLKDGASSEAVQKELSALLSDLESRGLADDLTMAIRAQASHPNAVVQVSNRLLQQHFAQPLDEAFRIDEVIAGTRVAGNGRLSGALECRPGSHPGVAGWTWSMQATSTSQSSGVSRGVQVDSTGTTSLSGSKRFHLDATGLSVLPAEADARTAIEFTGIRAGGGGRRQSTAVSEVYATRPRAEADSSASARRSIVQRLDGSASELLAEFQSHYDRTIKSPLGRSTLLVTTIRTAGSDDAQTWSCWLEELHGLAAPEPAPARLADADLAMSWHASFVERYAAMRLAGRTFTAGGLAKELDGWLGRDSSATGAAASPDQWRLKFAADHPITCRIADGQVHLSLRLAEFADSKSEYPAVQVHLAYMPRQSEGGWVLARIGAVEAYPLDYEPGTGKTLTGRQLVLRRAVQRSLENTLRQELALSPLEIKRGGAPALRISPREVRASQGWLSIDWQSAASTATVASMP